jgi:hypothetical protein
MKHLRETFTDEEFQQLLKAKDKSGKNWHDFIMYLSDDMVIETIETIQYEVAEAVEREKS